MNIESKEIYDEMADYVGNEDAWEQAIKNWEKIPTPIDDEEPKEWRLNYGNISADNCPPINHKKVNLSLYVVNAVNSHMVESIDELN